MIRAYYHLTKPGIIYGNTLVAIAAFFFASHGRVEWMLLFATMVGLALIIASGCVINNIFDKEIDAKMKRTQKRALVVGTISQTQAGLFATLLGLAGGLILFWYTTPLALGVAALGWFVYVCLYTPLKHHNRLALFVGAVA